MRKLFPILLLAFGGCMWGRVQTNDPSIVEAAKQLKPGVTSAVEVPRILGAPPMMRVMGRNAIYYNYTFGDSKNEGLMLVIFNLSRANSYNTTLSVEIDPETDLVREVYVPEVPELSWSFWPF